MLDDAIESGKLGDCFILYRPHPWKARKEGEEDFEALSWRHVLLSPDMRESYRSYGEPSGKRIKLADYEDTHTTLNAVDAVISPLSTILLEAAMHGKPIAAYLPDEDMSQNMFLYTTANMVHFRDFFERVECIRCESPDRLVVDCRRLLDMTDEPGIAERLKRQCEYFVEPSGLPYSAKLSSLIGELV